jgi:methylisocitrate lyase
MANLKKMLRSNKPIVIPGVYDAIGAKIAEKVGFEAMFQTGYGTSATLFGMPDFGFIGATETVDNARRICRAVSVPVIVSFRSFWNFSRRPKMAEKMWSYARKRSHITRRVY